MPNPTYKAIATTTVGAGGTSNIEFTSIPASYTDLVIKLSARSARSATQDFIQININTSASNFSARGIEGNGSTVTSFTDTVFFGAMPGASATASTFGSLEAYIPNYGGSTYKSYLADSVTENNAATAYTELVGGLWSQTSAITSIKLLSATSNNFSQYTTATLYGIVKS